MMRRIFDRLTPVIATALSATPFFACSAHAETASGIGLAGIVEYSSNPFLLAAGDTAAGRAKVSVSPYIEEREARSTLRVAADAGFSAYSRRYRETVDLSATADYRNSLSSQLSVRAGVSLSSSVGGIYNLVPVFSTAPVVPVVPQIIDITIIGSQDRTNQAQASAGASYLIDDRNSLSLDYDAAVIRYPVALRAEYSTIRQNASYSRTLNSRASIGASMGVTRIDYRGGTLGDSTILSPSINGSLRVAASWSLSASAGLSSSRLSVRGGRITSNNFSGSLNACRTAPRTNFCLNASRSTAASSFDGLRTTTSVGASFDYRLDARDSFSASGSYSRSSVPQQQFFTGLGSIDYLSGSVSWSRRFADRLSGNITAGYSRSGFETTRTNAYGSIGVNYSFGRQR